MLCSCCWGGSCNREVWPVSNQRTFPQKVHYALLEQQINLQPRTLLSSPFSILSSFRNFPYHRFTYSLLFLIPTSYSFPIPILSLYLFLFCTSTLLLPTVSSFLFFWCPFTILYLSVFPSFPILLTSPLLSFHFSPTPAIYLVSKSHSLFLCFFPFSFFLTLWRLTTTTMVVPHR